jgi:hypothetical protein
MTQRGDPEVTMREFDLDALDPVDRKAFEEFLDDTEPVMDTTSEQLARIANATEELAARYGYEKGGQE